MLHADGDVLATPLLRPCSEAREDPNEDGDGARAADAEITVDVGASSFRKRVLVTETEGVVGHEADWKSKLDDDSDGKCSFWQTTVNCLNILLGMGILALPSCLEEAGWLSLILLLGFAIICYYTGVLFGRCMRTDRRIKSYQDIGEAAFGGWGRTLVTAFLVLDIAAYLVGMIISMGDNLARIFPYAGLNLPWLGISLKPSQFLVTGAVLVALPTTWLPDMSSLALVSLGGVLTSFIVMGSVAWAGVFGGVGFSHSPPRLNLVNVPLASGIYGYCYAGHVLLPSVYTGMKKPAQFAQALLVAFVIGSGFLSGIAILGAVMFGEDAQSPITLSIPRDLTVGTIALWTAVLTPITKFGMGVAPLAEQIELFLPFSQAFHAASVPQHCYPYLASACGPSHGAGIALLL